MNVRRWNQRCNSKLAKLIILRILLFFSSLATTSNASKEKKRIEWKEKQTKLGTHTENNKHISRNEWKKTECRKKLQAKWHSTSRNVLQNFDNGTKFFGSTKLSTWWNFSRFVISHFTGSFFNVRQPQFVYATLSVCVLAPETVSKVVICRIGCHCSFVPASIAYQRWELKFAKNAHYKDVKFYFYFIIIWIHAENAEAIINSS